MIDGKRAARSGSIQSAAYHDERARHGGRDKGKGAEATSGRGCAPWGGGEYKGGREKAGAGGRKEGTMRRKDSAWRSGVGAAPRAYIYIYY